MKATNRYLVLGIVSLLLSLVMLMWALQTAWLGSFPGRENQPYAWWALGQLVVGVGLLVGAVISFIKVRRARRGNAKDVGS